jgi:hypothetical protein
MHRGRRWSVNVGTFNIIFWPDINLQIIRLVHRCMYVIHSTLILQTIKSKNVPDTIVLAVGAAVTLKTVLQKSSE